MNIDAAERIKYLRKTSGYTQQELSEKMGLDKNYISKVERLERGLTLENAIKLADLFECSVDYLIGRSESESDIYDNIEIKSTGNNDKIFDDKFCYKFDYKINNFKKEQYKEILKNIQYIYHFDNYLSDFIKLTKIKSIDEIDDEGKKILYEALKTTLYLKMKKSE